MSVQPKVTKQDRAYQIAQANFNQMPEGELIVKIREQVPCSKSTAFGAVQKVKRERLQPAAEEAKITVISEEPKTPEYITPPEIEEIKPSEEVAPIAEEAVEIDYIKDMLRGVYDLILSKEGILGEKYGRKPEQVHLASDQLFRWLERRVTLEQLEKYDTLLLILAHGVLVGGIAKDVLADRRKAQVVEEKKTSREKKMEAVAGPPAPEVPKPPEA